MSAMPTMGPLRPNSLSRPPSALGESGAIMIDNISVDDEFVVELFWLAFSHQRIVGRVVNPFGVAVGLHMRMCFNFDTSRIWSTVDSNEAEQRGIRVPVQALFGIQGLSIITMRPYEDENTRRSIAGQISRLLDGTDGVEGTSNTVVHERAFGALQRAKSVRFWRCTDHGQDGFWNAIDSSLPVSAVAPCEMGMEVLPRRWTDIKPLAATSNGSICIESESEVGFATIYVERVNVRTLRRGRDSSAP
ncbi:uncharacterized protein EV422DRAFT_509659 [Fimicolochytrium jonesii]|uniref:uncharacterized protein n=1 Tax=Fimicolochytrium jonesii TaxID=1396493 RepID=UPI0022FE06DD|nr:uncharacterized protein EV422DRAFT_509659 [Fimicolochytrium jonesii]KAI8816618.1 hypothetical protein EV422DRAFT_509659 [Fimicolochytrium jonesii]